MFFQKKIQLVLFAVSTALSLYGAELEKVKPLSYDYQQPTLEIQTQEKEHGDPGRIKLIDGVKKSPSRIIWIIKDFKNKPVEVDFKFPAPVNFKLVKVHIFRWKRAYGLKRINVTAKTQDGKQLILGGIHPNQPYKLPEGDPYYMPLDIKLNSDQAVDNLKITISGISRISLTEVEFFKAPQRKLENKVVKHIANPFEKAVLAEGQGYKLVEKDFNNDGKTDILLQNNQVSYLVEPSNNGIISLAYDRMSKCNLIKPQLKGTYGGMFNDRFWPGGNKNRDVYRHVAYSYKIVSNNDKLLAVKVWAAGKSGFFSNVIINKTYSLTKGSRALKVDYHITNDKANVVPLNYGLWIMGGIFSPKDKIEIIYPGSMGIEKNSVKHQSLWAPGAVKGWNAVMTDTGNGLAMTVDYKLLKTFYYWSNETQATTMECRLGVYPIKAGSFLNTTFYLLPFHGIDIPQALNQNVAASLSLKSKYEQYKANFDLNVLPSHSGNYEIILEAGRYISGKLKYKEFKKITKKLEPIPYKFPVEYKIYASGTWVFRVTVKEYGNTLLSFTKATEYKRSTGTYLCSPECAKKPEKTAKKQSINLDFHSLKIQTKHVNWARPFAGKKPKVLLVCKGKGGIRDLVEVAQRFEIDLHTNYVTGIWRLGDFCTTLNEKDCYYQLAQKLSKNKYDSIVVSSNIWEYLPKDCTSSILKQVEEGSGLVLIAPEKLPEKLNKSFSLETNPKRFYGQWKSPQTHSITAGIPFSALPKTNALPYITSGKILANVDTKPLLAIFDYGKGRVSAASWDVSGKFREGYYNTYSQRVILPRLLYTGVGDIQYDYWEYQLSLLARMIYWTAKVPFEVEGKKLEVDSSSKFNIEIASTSSKDVTLNLVIRDKYYTKKQEKNVKATLKSGNNKLTVNFNKPAMGGKYFADLIVKSSKGTEWWGSKSFTIETPVCIKSIKADDKVWKKEDIFKISAELNSSSNNKIQLSLFDSFGNEFAQKVKSANSQNVSFEVPLNACKTIAFEARIKLIKANNTVSEKRKVFALYHKPDKRKMQVAFGWPNLSMRGVHRFLIKKYYSRLQDLCATTLKLFRTDTPYDLMQARELGLAYMCSSTSISSGGKFPYDKNLKSTDKFDLIRKPCLSAKGFKDKLENVSAKPKNSEAYGVLYRGGPDEANSITKWDGCFSKDCQREFRKWLKAEYGSLDNLNKSWLTDYKNWDEVVAMTTEEVKNRASFAPWVDHLSFNDWNRADAIGRIVKGIKKSDPNLRYALSGTQETKAYNAWDWFLLMKHLGAIESYGGEQTVQQRSFYDGKLIWNTWIGYDRDYEFLNWKILNYLMQGATGFNVYSGGFYVNPDYTYPKSAIALKKAFANYSNGPAEAVINSKMMTYPIALLYSPASIKVNSIIDLADKRTMSVQGVNDILRNCGFDYDCIAYKQLENSNLLQKKYKILFLPISSALSNKEISTIRDFVSNGGILVADILAGEYDQHGKKRKINPLDEVFGIKRADSKCIQQNAKLSGDISIKVNEFETGITVTTGKALAEIKYKGKKSPAIVCNNFGKGKAIYFACGLPASYGNWQVMRYFKNNIANAAKIRNLICKSLDNIGVKPRVEITNDKGEKLKAAEIFMRMNADARILGIVRCFSQAKNIDSKAGKFQIKLEKSYYAYDLVNKKYLGHSKSIPYMFAPDSQTLISLLPYQVRGIKVTKTSENKTLKFKIALEADTSNFCEHILNVVIEDSKGRVNKAFSKMLFTKNGKSSFKLQIPYNAVKGEWKVKITDVLSLTKAESIIKIK